jgi:hypothetical protein
MRPSWFSRKSPALDHTTRPAKEASPPSR